MKVALVYDRVNKWGGAERVLLSLHKLFPNAPLYTSVYNPHTAKWAKVFPKIHTSFLNRLPFAKTRHDLYAAFMPIAFESFNFSEYGLVISVTSEAAKGIITKPGTTHICYCLTPTRYLWSGHNQYLGGVRKILSQPLVAYLKWWDKTAAQRPDIIVSISQTVAKRVEKYYGRKSPVIYPPVNTKIFTTPLRRSVVSKDEKPYLIVSRLVSYKKVDLVVKVFNRLKKPLIVVGTGSEEKKLRGMTRSNIIFTGFVEDDLLQKYYVNARALIFPQEEDFGIVAVEAQAAGTPVIAYKKGGAMETVTEKTGVFFDEQTADSLNEAIVKCEKKSFKEVDCKKNAEKFSEEKFQKNFATLVSAALLKR
ncbi:MAG: glycosyltransferase [Patescibacteria group bacterium]